MATSEWDIDSWSGHCVHPSGLHAYIDFQTTPSGAIRVMGPFGAEQMRRSTVFGSMKSFVRFFEKSELVTGGRPYVVWGGFEETPRFVEHTFFVANRKCGFVPHLNLRSAAGGVNIHDAEWVQRSDGLVRHRSGLQSCETYDEFDLDPWLFHPDSRESLVVLAESLVAHGLEINIDVRVNWTQFGGGLRSLPR